MKYLLSITLIFSSFLASSKEVSKNAKKVAPEKKEIAKAAPSPAPCDSKEDLLKKIAEKEKAKNEKPKGFSLQGGDTGCSIK